MPQLHARTRLGRNHTWVTHTHPLPHLTAYWLNKPLCQETEAATMTEAWRKKRREGREKWETNQGNQGNQGNRTATHCNEPNRTGANRSEPKRCDAPKTEPHALYFHNLFFRFSQNFPERGEAVGEGSGIQGATASCSTACTSSGNDFRLALLCRKYFFCPDDAGKSETDANADSEQCHAVCASASPAASFPLPPHLCSAKSVARFFCSLKIAKASLIYRLIGVSES